MVLQLRLFMLTILLPALFLGQSRNLWSEAKLDQINPKDIIEYSLEIKNQMLLNLDKNTISSILLSAPNRHEVSSSPIMLELPNPIGGFDTFEMFSTQTMARELAEMLPEVKSYVGRNINKKSHRIRITISPYGFYAMSIGSEKGQTFINPYARNNDVYVVFSKHQVEKDPLQAMLCEVDDTFEHHHDHDVTSFSDNSNLISDSKLRKYRIGIASTSQYSTFHWQQAGIESSATDNIKRNAVQAAMVVTLDRVNEMYERDLGVTFEFIPNNMVLIVIDPTQDPYSNNSVSLQLNQNQTRFNQLIGAQNFDIGHVFSTAGSGVAVFQSVCNSNFKAQGATGLSQPSGDIFDIDYVSHEIGHQLGANHTFNESCFGNRNNATAVEPGAGSTIMAYAGVCVPGPQNSSDALFHQISIFEMRNYFNTLLGGCAEQITINNQAPIISTIQNYSIPKNTPFMLTAIATDPNDDILSFSWEQLDPEIIPSPPTGNTSDGPIFRSFLPSNNPIRYFPSLTTLLSNQYGNNWEVLPQINRSINFGVAVRDNNILGGQVSRELTTVNVLDAGPFRVTSQEESGIIWQPGETKTINWTVANTNDPNGVNAQFMDILLSIDNGQTYTIELASNIPNNGSADITVPDIFTNSGRIMVKASDNIFFDLNSAYIAIDGEGGITEDCEDFLNNNPFEIPDGIGENTQGTPIFSTIEVEDNVIISSIKVSVDVSHTYIQDLVIQLIGPDEQFINLFLRDCLNEQGIQVTFDDLGQPIPDNCDNPLVGVFAPSDINKSLQQWNGISAQGDWTIAIADFYIGDTGTLNNWGLEICTSSLGVNEQTTNTFGIYPNPNNGQFVLSLNSPLEFNTNAKIYNLQGKLIQEIPLKSDRILQNISLQKVAKGIYLFEVNDGNSRIVEKLIIK